MLEAKLLNNKTETENVRLQRWFKTCGQYPVGLLLVKFSTP